MNSVNANMNDRPIIGLIGGSGPWAGLDVENKIFKASQRQSGAILDQDYCEVIHYQCTQLSDRNDAYTDGNTGTREQYAKCINMLKLVNASVIAIACNSAHIYFKFLSENTSVPMINLISETVLAIKNYHPSVKKVGLIATNATINSKVYYQACTNVGLEVAYLPSENQSKIMEAMYQLKAGWLNDGCMDHVIALQHDKSRDELKIHPYKSILVTAKPRSPLETLSESIEQLIDDGCEKIILGCTEFPLLIPQLDNRLKKYVVDPNEIVAEKLVAYHKKILEQRQQIINRI